MKIIVKKRIHVEEVSEHEIKVPYYGRSRIGVVSVELDVEHDSALVDMCNMPSVPGLPPRDIEHERRVKSRFNITTVQHGFAIPTIIKKHHFYASDVTSMEDEFPMLYVEYCDEMTEEDFDRAKKLAMQELCGTESIVLTKEEVRTFRDNVENGEHNHDTTYHIAKFAKLINL